MHGPFDRGRIRTPPPARTGARTWVRIRTPVGWSLLLSAAVAAPALAQAGSVRGTVTLESDGAALENVLVEIPGTRLTAVTGPDGRYLLAGIEPGARTIRFTWLGHEPVVRELRVDASAVTDLDVALPARPIHPGDVRVESVGVRPGRVMDAPASVTVVDPWHVADRAAAGQAPLLLADVPGVQVAQGGSEQFVVASRSFVDLAGRRVLVRVDGRDLAANSGFTPEWGALHLSEPGTRLEVLRGPASALYGAGAFGAVLDIRTPTVREAPGGRVSLGLGDLDGRDVRARWGVVGADLRWGLRVEGGWSRTRGFARSRTDLGDLYLEYLDATDSPIEAPFPGYERIPLAGQTRTTPDGIPGPSVGEPDPQTMLDGAIRVDRYLDGGGVLTGEAGVTRMENQVVVTDASRAQFERTSVPWARIALRGNAYDVTAYYGGRSRSGTDLASGAVLEDRSSRFDVEGRVRAEFRDGAVLMMAGLGARAESFDSRGTLLERPADGRTEGHLSAFGRGTWDLRDDLRLSFAGRVEDSSLWGDQLSSRWGLTWSPTDAHTLRITHADAYVPPTVADEFARVPIADPVDLIDVEAVIRGSPLGPAMGGVPDGELFTNSAAVPLLVIGNPSLDPETVEEVELGYAGRVGRALLSAAVHRSEFDAFLSDFLPDVHPDFGPWRAPAAIGGEAGDLVGAFARDLVPGLTRLEDGRTAIVYTRTNTGRATQWGLDLSLGVHLTDELLVNGTWGLTSVEVEEGSFVGEPRSPNAPRHLVGLSASWTDPGGIRARLGLRSTSGFDFRDGVFAGYVPPRQSVDLDVRGPIGRRLDVGLSVTNALDQQRFQYVGGSVIGRRLVATLTWSR